MKILLEKIKQAKDNLNKELDEPQFIKELREYAFYYLEKVKIDKKQVKKIKELLSDFEMKTIRDRSVNEFLDVHSDIGDIDFNVLDFKEIPDRSQFFSEYVFSNMGEETDFFVLLNLSLFCGGGILAVSDTADGSDFYISHLSKMPLGLVLITVIDSGQIVRIHESCLHENSNNDLAGGLHRVYVHDGAQLYYDLFFNNNQAREAFSKEFFLDARAKTFLGTAICGGQKARIFLGADLRDPESSFVHKGVYLGGNDQDLELIYNVNHKAEGTQSETYVKGMLTSNAKIDFIGNVFVANGCKAVEALLSESSIALSEDIQKTVLPVLRINTDDVKVNHSSSSLQIDPQKMFYLESKGIPKDYASKMYVAGFLKDCFGYWKSQLSALTAKVIDEKIK